MYFHEQGFGACYSSAVNDVIWYGSSPAVTNYARIFSEVMLWLIQLDAGFSLQSLRFSPG